jgi:hypothetical protein
VKEELVENVELEVEERLHFPLKHALAKTTWGTLQVESS